MTTLMVLLVVLGIIVLVVGFVGLLYNGLIQAKMRVKEAWSGIDVQLKRRSDLVPNLVETVKGYAQHEREIFENVAKARSALLGAKDPKTAAQADGELTRTLKTLFAVAEAYPQLRASENFQKLQSELSDIEAKIAYARQFYNSNVMEYNTRIKVFPNVLISRALGFTEVDFFAATEEERAVVKVKFTP